ncbi:VWA domain-containing protein [Mycobacterium sp. SMC-4]|nr:VWA domain-containing protein [Mycobacterium sp. SMC-4]
MLGACSSEPTDQQQDSASFVPSASSVPTVLILDGSGSMTETDAPGPRIDAAKTAARALVEALPDASTIALQTYGITTGSAPEDKADGCRDVTLLLSLRPLDREAMNTAIASIAPSGYTPISLALQTAADQLPADDTAQAIVLVSDGEETCDTPPCDTATQLKQARPGLTISTVGFKVDGAAAEQLRCIAELTGGIYVQAANADQLAARLMATQNIDQANTSLSSTGLGGIDLGTPIADIRATHPGFPQASDTGTTTVTWIDCDFTFIDGVLNAIAPRNGGRTIDGVTRGTDIQVMADLYGEPVSVDAATNTVIYRADGTDRDSKAAYRVRVNDFAESAGRVYGRVGTIVLCLCAPQQAGSWTDPVVIVTPGSVGSAKLGMSQVEVERAAGVKFVMPCTQCDATPTAALPEGFPYYEYGYNGLNVVLGPDDQVVQVVQTAEGFRLGGTVEDLLRTYGNRLAPYEALGMHNVRGYVLEGDGGYLLFNTLSGYRPDQSGNRVYEFRVQQNI